MFAASYGYYSGKVRQMGPAALVLVVALSAAGCASTGAVPRPFPTPGVQGRQPAPAPPTDPVADPVPPTEPAAPAGALAFGGEAIAGTALALRGVPYRNGGSDPAGFDCSGFVSYVFGQHGVPVPRTVIEQYHAGSDVAGGELRAGDLVFFDTNGSGVSHVGIAIGGNAFVHAPSSSGEVRVERLVASYWSKRYLGARRLM